MSALTAPGGASSYGEQSSPALQRVEAGSPGAAGLVHVRTLTTPPQLQRDNLRDVSARALGPGPLNSSQPAYTLNITAAFYGLHYGCNQTIYCTTRVPPDVQVASSPNFVLEMVNAIGEIRDIQGQPAKVFYLTSLFQANGTDFVFDPRVVFDNSSQRWFAVASDRTDGTVRLAVSQSSDPTGGWWTYRFALAAGTWADQPSIGVSDDKLVIPFNEYVASDNSFAGAEYWIMAKNATLSGSSLSYIGYGPDNRLFSIHPAKEVGSNNTIYMASVEEERGYVKFFRIEGSPPAPRIFTFELPVSAITPPSNASQYRTNFLISTGGTRAMDAVWRNGRLWLSFTDGCVPQGDSLSRSCIRLVQIDVDKQRVLQNFLLSETGYFYFYPTISLDSAGNLVVAFGYSSAGGYAGLAAWAQPIDAPGAIQTPMTLQAGMGPTTTETGSCQNGVCRYGDYFGSSIDLHGGGVWVAGEFSNLSGWSTKIVNVAVRKVLTTVPMTINYDIVGGGSGYSPPVLTYNVNGEIRRDLLSTSPTTYYVDIGSEANVTQVLASSTQTERWITNQSTTETARRALDLTFYYVHQYAARFEWAVSDGSPAAAPVVKITQFGSPSSEGLPNAQASLWTDAGSSWNISRILNGTDPQERWITEQVTNGTVVSSFGGVFSYKHQFLVSSSTPGGGVVSPSSGWYDSGSFVTLAASARLGWKFQEWQGTGLSSYSGSSNPVGIAVSGPVTEAALFFPGITIASSSGGSVYYSFGLRSGTVNESEAWTVYVPSGTRVSLSASPSSPFTTLTGWAGNVTGAATTISVNVSSPMALGAQFGINYLAVGIVLLSIFAAGGALSIRRRRRLRRVPPEKAAADD